MPALPDGTGSRTGGPSESVACEHCANGPFRAAAGGAPRGGTAVGDGRHGQRPRLWAGAAGRAGLRRSLAAPPRPRRPISRAEGVAAGTRIVARMAG